MDLLNGQPLATALTAVQTAASIADHAAIPAAHHSPANDLSAEQKAAMPGGISGANPLITSAASLLYTDNAIANVGTNFYVASFADPIPQPPWVISATDGSTLASVGGKMRLYRPINLPLAKVAPFARLETPILSYSSLTVSAYVEAIAPHGTDSVGVACLLCVGFPPIDGSNTLNAVGVQLRVINATTVYVDTLRFTSTQPSLSSSITNLGAGKLGCWIKLNIEGPFFSGLAQRTNDANTEPTADEWRAVPWHTWTQVSGGTFPHMYPARLFIMNYANSANRGATFDVSHIRVSSKFA